MSSPDISKFDEALLKLQELGRTTRETVEDGSVSVTIDISPETMGISLAPGQTLGSALLEQVAGVHTADAQTQGICGWCKQPVTGFKDEISKREYRISSMCQSCQDQAFVEPEENDE